MKFINKKNVIIIIIIIIIILLIILVLYNLFNSDSYAINDDYKCLTTSLGDDFSKNIEINSMVGLTNEDGIINYPLVFTVTNNCDVNAIFNIKAEINRITNINVSNIVFAYNSDIISLNDLSKNEVHNGLFDYMVKENITIEANKSSIIEFRVWESGDNNSESTEKTLSVKLKIEEI